MEEEKQNSKELDETTIVAELLQRVGSHDMAAFRQLYDSFSGLLMGVIQSILKNTAESEDILQDSFMTIWNKADMYQPHLGKPTSWMITIAKNKAYDRYRKLVRKSDGMAVIKEAMEVPIATQPVISKNEHLSRAMRELNDEQKKAIELVFYEGYTQQEAAEKLDTPLGTVKARIRRGLLKLKQTLTNN